MKINFYNNPQVNKKNHTQVQFKGRGIDLINNWILSESSKTPARSTWYDDICRDLVEGVRLYFTKNKAIDESVINFHRCDGLTMFFDIPNNEIIKVSLENPLEYRKHIPEFDIPFLSPVEKYGKTYIVKQPKADIEGITPEHYKDVVKRIYSHGCELSMDAHKYEQYGLYNGIPYLIDTRCAMPMPNTYTRLIDILCERINKCYVIVNPEHIKYEKEEGIKNKGYFYYHTDETPRKNLNFKGGIIKLFNTIKNNIKYRKKHYCIPYEENRALNAKMEKYYF